MPVDSNEDSYSTLSGNYHNSAENTNDAGSRGTLKDQYIMPKDGSHTESNLANGNKEQLEQRTGIYDSNLPSVRPKVLMSKNTDQREQWKQYEPNKWRKMVGFHVSGSELKSSLFSKKQKSKKLRFAQAKKNLNQLYSYFSVRIIECKEKNNLIIGLARKDFPSSSELGVTPGSIGYDAGNGYILAPHEPPGSAPQFSEGDIIGCGVVFPPHYRKYADLSTDDSSDGMTDVVLTSLLNLNKKSMDFVQCVLGLRRSNSDSSSSEEEFFFKESVKSNDETDYYNENYIESRTKVEVYFTHNMQIIGKITTCIPIDGFYPTLQVSSASNVRLQFDFS